MVTQAAKMSKEEIQGGSGSGLPQKVTGTIADTKAFLAETRVEMKKVTWPSRDDVVSTTGVVLATVAFFAVYLFFVEQGATRLVTYLFHKFGG
jgi:preprotein translocase subunit SecE